MSVRVTKLERAPEGYWTANLTVDGVTTPVQKASGSWQTRPDTEGVTQGVLPWAAAHLQERLTAVLLEQATNDKEREAVNFLRRAALAAVRTLTRPERKALKAYQGAHIPFDEPEMGVDFKGRAQPVEDGGLSLVPTPVTHIDTKRVAQRMAAAGRTAAEGDRGDAA